MNYLKLLIYGKVLSGKGYVVYIPIGNARNTCSLPYYNCGVLLKKCLPTCRQKMVSV